MYDGFGMHDIWLLYDGNVHAVCRSAYYPAL